MAVYGKGRTKRPIPIREATGQVIGSWHQGKVVERRNPPARVETIGHEFSRQLRFPIGK